MKSLGWLILVVAVECIGIVACSKIPGVGDNEPKNATKNIINFDGPILVREFYLRDGTHCALLQTNGGTPGGITCDWTNK